MKILHLTLTKKWFKRHLEDKPEDYRRISAYWLVRLFQYTNGHRIRTEEAVMMLAEWLDGQYDLRHIEPIKYDAAEAKNGYSATAPMFRKKYHTVEIGVGNPEWGAPDDPVFILKLGAVLETRNCEQIL